MDAVIDQVQNDSPVSETSDTEDQVTPEQSETTDVVEDSNLFDLPDGRKLTGEQLRGEYLNLNSDYTKKSQRLAEIERQSKEMEARAEDAAKEAVDKSSLLEGVDPNVKELIQQISLEGFKSYMSAERAKEQQAQKDAEWQRRFDETMKKHDGSDGFPKAEKEALMKYMVENEVYNPEEAYNALTREQREDILIKQALKDRGVPSSTESTGGETPRKPSEKTPSTWEEATKAAWNRISS